MEKKDVKKPEKKGFDDVSMLLLVLFVVLVIWLVVAVNSEKLAEIWNKSDLHLTGNAVYSEPFSKSFGNTNVSTSKIFNLTQTVNITQVVVKWTDYQGDCQVRVSAGTKVYDWTVVVSPDARTYTNSGVGSLVKIESKGCTKTTILSLKVTGFSALPEINLNCTDSDGLNYFSKGNITGNFANGTNYSKVDFCINTTMLKEYSCNADLSSNESNITCANGCLDNACNQPAQATYNCTGTAPVRANGVIIGPNITTSASNAWAYSPSATTSTSCRWKCDSGYSQNGNTCRLNSVCSSDIGCSNVSIEDAHTISGTCSAGASCYHCDSGYSWDSDYEECQIDVSEGAWSKISLISPEELEAGYTGSLSSKEAFKMIILDEYHYVGVISLTSSSATINISSKSQQKTFSAGNEFQFDLDSDGVNDLKIKLNSIQSGKASLTLWSLEPVITPVTQSNEDTTTSTSTNQETSIETDTSTNTAGTSETEASQGTGSSWFVIILIIMIIAVILALLFVYLKKTGKLDKLLKKKGSGSASPALHNMPRPPFPPMNPMMNQQRPMPMQRPMSTMPRPGFLPGRPPAMNPNIPPARPGLPPPRLPPR